MPEQNYGGYSVEDLLPGLQHYESGGRRYAVSGKGAIGLYQIMPETAAQYGYSREDMFDPVKNEDVARRYLGDLMDKYKGNAYLAVAAYNEGPRTVGEGTIYPETVQHVRNVLNYTRDYGGGKRAGTIQRVRQATSVPGGTTERPAVDPLEAQIEALQKEVKDWGARLQPPDAPPELPPPRTTQLPFMFYRGGTGDVRSDISTVPSIFDPGANLKQAWKGIEPTLQAGYSKIEPYTSQVVPSLTKLFRGVSSYLPQQQVQAIKPDPGETIS